MQRNPYVVMTIELFRVQLLAARATGDVDEAEAFEAAIRSLLEDSASGLDLESAGRAVPVAN